MTCETCGKKSKKCGNCNKNFPNAVIEINNPEALVMLRKVVIPTSMGTEEQVPAVVGKYHNVVLYYEANKHVYLYSSDGIPTDITADIPQEVLDSIAELEGDVDSLQQQIDDLKNSPDVVDIVPTYAALQAYDTSKLGNNDIVRVLQDEMHDGQSTYYRWNSQTESWTYIGSVGDYYTKGQVDTLLAGKQDELTAGSNISITQVDDDLVISATDTTYSNFVGTDGVDNGTAGLVPAPLTTDAGKFLKADGTWDTAGGGGPTVVQTTGTSTTDVMSQNATSSMVFADPDTRNNIRIGNGANNNGTRSVVIGGSASSSSYNDCVVVGEASSAIRTSSSVFGKGSSSISAGGTALGCSSTVSANNFQSVALGSYATTSRTGEVNIGTGAFNYGYNSTNYRVLGGVHDGIDNHDAATVGQLDGRVKQNAGAPTTATVGTIGQLLEDTTNGKLYQCTAVDTTDPNNPSYTWTEVGAGGGGGPTVVQTTGTSQTDVMSQKATTDMIYSPKTTSTYNNWGAVYIGNKNSSNQVIVDPSTSDTHETYFYALPYDNTVPKSRGINILGSITNGQGNISIGQGAQTNQNGGIALGFTAHGTGNESIGIGSNADTDNKNYSVALGYSAKPTRNGEVNVGSGNYNFGYNSTPYRILGGVHDGVDAHDAVTKNQLDGLITLTTTDPGEGQPLAANHFIGVYQ